MGNPKTNITPVASVQDLTQKPATTVFDDQEYRNFSKSNTAQFLDSQRPATYSRRMLTWRTPHLGYVEMYINPQQLSIQEKKIITPTRTKGGYVVQYAGEDLISIVIRGTTGSGGMEGINVLRSIYRSEQDAFTGMAQALETKLTSTKLYSLFKGTNSQGTLPFQDIETLL